MVGTTGFEPATPCTPCSRILTVCPYKYSVFLKLSQIFSTKRPSKQNQFLVLLAEKRLVFDPIFFGLGNNLRLHGLGGRRQRRLRTTFHRGASMSPAALCDAALIAVGLNPTVAVQRHLLRVPVAWVFLSLGPACKQQH